MATYSLTQAAKATGKSKPTISKAIKTGRLSAKRVGAGYEIDAAELFRVYPKEPEIFDVGLTGGEHQVALLEMEAKMLRQQLEREQETVTDLRARLTRMETLITDERPGPSPGPGSVFSGRERLWIVISFAVLAGVVIGAWLLQR